VSELEFRHTQPGTVIVASMLAAFAFAVWYGLAANWDLAARVEIWGVAAVGLLFHSLTIEIDHERFRCFFGFGLIRRTFPLSEVAAVRRVRNRWFYGWGIRLIRSGWMFNVSGFDAVELELRSGRRFRVGTDRPDDVIEAFERLHGRAA
jgi:hypothetical protein